MKSRNPQRWSIEGRKDMDKIIKLLSRGRKRGWFYDSERHALAKYGFRTSSKAKKKEWYRYMEDTDWANVFTKASVIIAGLGVSRAMLVDLGYAHGRMKVRWDFSKTNNSFFDESILDPENPKRIHDGTLVMLDTNVLMDYQERISPKVFERISRPQIESFKEFVMEGAEFHPFVLEFSEKGELMDYLENENKITAMKEIGVKEVPVWMMRRRS